MCDFDHSESDDLLDRAVDSVLRSLIPDELAPDRVSQLTAVVQRAADRPVPGTLITRIKNMKTRTRIAIAATVLLALIGPLSWIAPGGGAALAFDEVAKALTEVTSARWKSTTVYETPKGKKITREEIGMFLAPSHERMEATTRDAPRAKTISIFHDRKAIILNTLLKQATVLDVKMDMPDFPEHEGPYGRTFLGLRELAAKSLSGKQREATPLGERVIDGRRGVGFRLLYGDVETRIWADPNTSAPLRVELVGSEFHAVMTDFEIGVDLDKSLFSLDVPKGYTVNAMRLEFPKNPIVFLAKTLGMAAEANDDVFPPALLGESGLHKNLSREMRKYMQKKFPSDHLAKRFGETPDEMKKRGFDKPDARKAVSELQKTIAEVSMNVGGGAAALNSLSPKLDWHYAGKGVKLNEPNRPIFWMKSIFPKKGPKGWQKDDKYVVIYADLSVREVAPEDVPNVPGSESSSEK